jgi:Na+-driven multidrug efflux pump
MSLLQFLLATGEKRKIAENEFLLHISNSKALTPKFKAQLMREAQFTLERGKQMVTKAESTSSIKDRLAATFKPYQWGFIGFLIVAALIPKLYELSNTFWIGHISYEALAITEQYEFLGVTIEIVNETIPFGVLALVAQNYTNKERVISILKSGLILQLIFSSALTAIVVLFKPQFVSTIGTPAEIVTLTQNYLVLKAIALPFESIALLLLISIKSMRKGKDVLYLVLFSVILNMILDLFLISNTNVSLNLGVEGAAIGYVISKIALFLITVGFTIKILGIKPTSLSLHNWNATARSVFSIGGWTGLDSLVRNIGYILVPLNVLNIIGANQYGGYGLAMTVMWTLIIPVLAITEGTNVVIGNYYGEHKHTNITKVILTSLFLIAIAMTAIAVGGAFFWNSLSAFFNQNPIMVQYSTATFWWLIIPYFLFGLGMILKSVFYGTGKTRYLFYISAFSNFVLIFPFWILAKLNLVTASFDNVMALFVIVFAADLTITYLIVRKVLNRINTQTMPLKVE